MIDELLLFELTREGLHGLDDFSIFDMKVTVMDGDEFVKAFVIGDIAFDNVFHPLSFPIEKAPGKRGSKVICS